MTKTWRDAGAVLPVLAAPAPAGGGGTRQQAVQRNSRRKLGSAGMDEVDFTVTAL
jgi:hypothetical protein